MDKALQELRANIDDLKKQVGALWFCIGGLIAAIVIFVVGE